MRARAVAAASEIDAVRGCVAFERGPLVYCFEGIDLPKGEDLRAISVDTSVSPREEPGFDIATNAVVALRLSGRVHAMPSRPDWPYRGLDSNGGKGVPASGVTGPVERAIELRSTPYYAWANRGTTSMRVWVPQS